MSDQGELVLGSMRFFGFLTMSGYPYLSLYCSVQPWHGATLGVHLAWFGFVAGWEPFDQEDSDW